MSALILRRSRVDDDLLAHLYRGRGLDVRTMPALAFADLLRPDLLPDVDIAVERLVGAEKQRILVVGDFDADGATASAITVRGLRQLGYRDVTFLVPERARFGYGLSVGLVDEILRRGPDLVITVDHGSTAVEGVASLRAAGIDVLITDHHLCSEVLPAALAIVNPCRPESSFGSRALCGAGTAFYLLLALRARLQRCGRLVSSVALSPLLDLVALGTIADLVPLDRNNRILVDAGLRRIRAGHGCAGIKALFAVAGRDMGRAQAQDLAFAIAPRLNAAGRLEDMALGVRLLLSDNVDQARMMALQLNELNQARKAMQQSMLEDAERLLARIGDDTAMAAGVCVYDDSWHEGIVGLIAGRLREQHQRPSFALAPSQVDADLWRGSGRSVPGLNLRDLLVELDRRHSGLLERFGGHAMAAGVSLRRKELARFALAFVELCAEWQPDLSVQRRFHSDGPLRSDELTLDALGRIECAGPWGQGFAEPIFDQPFTVTEQRLVGGQHLRLKLLCPASLKLYDAIAFSQRKVAFDHAHALYALSRDGRASNKLMLRIDQLLPADSVEVAIDQVPSALTSH